MKRAILAWCVLLGGCHGTVAFQWGMSAGLVAQAATASVVVIGAPDSAAGTVLVGAAVADAARFYATLPDGTRMPYYGAPELHPGRSINIQDCTLPIDLEAGNLMCR